VKDCRVEIPEQGADVAIPADWAGKRIKLLCKHRGGEQRAVVNGEKHDVGHPCTHFNFELDITSTCRPGEANRIHVPPKSQLFVLPEVNVARLEVDTAFDERFDNATMNVRLAVANQGKADAPAVKVRLELVGPDGRWCEIQPREVELGAIRAGAAAERTLEIPVARPRKWDHDHPNLYFLRAALTQGGQELQAAQRRFGFRQIELRENELYINGRPVKLRGMAFWAHQPGTTKGRPSAETTRSILKMFRETNVNHIRIWASGHGEIAEVCDELGITVAAQMHFGLAASGDMSIAAMVPSAAHAAATYYSNPSVIMCSVSNEKDPGIDGHRAAARTLKTLDPSRAVLASRVKFGDPIPWPSEYDVHADHYISNKAISRLVLDGYPWYFDEFCQPARRLSWDGYDPGTYDQYGEMIETQWEHVQATKGAVGVATWCGYGHGSNTFLFDPFARPSAAVWHVKKVYCPVRIAEEPLRVPPAGGPLRIPVENRSPFCALKEYRFDWRLGDRKGTVSPDVPALGSGEIEVPAPAVAGQTLELTVTHPLGYVMNNYRLPIGPVPAPVPPKPSFSGALKLAESADEIAIQGEGFSWQLDRKTGLVKAGRVGQRAVVVGGPALHLSRLSDAEANYQAIDRGKIDAGQTPAAEDKTKQTQPRFDWTADEVRVEQTGEAVVVTIKGKYPWASGQFTMSFDGAGAMRVRHGFVFSMTGAGLRGTSYESREVGVNLDVTGACDTLQWNRRARWTTYPEDHIGRPQGTARLSLSGKWPPAPEEYEKAEAALFDANNTLIRAGRGGEIKLPAEPWSLAECPNGTHNFAGTKYNIYHASLTAADGSGVRVESDASQSARCWVQGHRLALFVGFSGSGSVRSTMDVTKRIKLADKDKIEGTAVFRLVRQPGIN
jgi:hypothetical protein